jgi:hypothetical protein
MGTQTQNPGRQSKQPPRGKPGGQAPADDGTIRSGPNS